MVKAEFETLLSHCCLILTNEAKTIGFTSSRQFEDRVRRVLSELACDDGALEIDFNSPSQAFPDIAMGEFGVEVKYTKSDTWRSIANSVLETQRVPGIKVIYVIFGKMGGIPEVRWADYANSIIHVRTSHVPRFEIEIAADPSHIKQSLFDQMGIYYDIFQKLDMSEKMKYIRDYARKIHPDGRLWWIEDSEKKEHTLPIQARLYTKLPSHEKRRLRAEAALVSPEIVGNGRDKYNDVVLYLLTYHGVLCHQARDLFSAGSVANPNNDDNGGRYILRALKLIESDMRIAAQEMDDSIFVEYWGASVAAERRIKEWLKKADKAAKGWKPSECLFLDE